MLVPCPDLDAALWGRRTFCINVGLEFLLSSCSSGVAALGFFGRGTYNSQWAAWSASQPHWGCTCQSPWSAAIQSVTLRLVLKPLFNRAAF